MPGANLSTLPVELFARILEDIEILDILRLKLLNRQVYQIICCSNRIKYRVELFLAGAEDGNYYSLEERQQSLRSYRSNWESLTPQGTTTIPVPDHGIYELAGGVYGLVPNLSPNSIRFYRLPSFSRRIELEEWAISDLDFSIDDFTMECAYDLLVVFAYKTGNVKVHFLKLSGGEPHPRARKPFVGYDIPLDPTESGWRIESVILENRLGCLFTSISGDKSVDTLLVWDWTTGDLVLVLSQYGNRSFTFLDEDTIVAAQAMGTNRPSLAFFDLTDEKRVISPLTLPLPQLSVGNGLSYQIRLNLGIPIRHGPQLRVHVPFVINSSQQMLFIIAFIVGSAGFVIDSHSIAVPLSRLRDWTQETVPNAKWNFGKQDLASALAGNPLRATFTMGSRFVAFNFPTSFTVEADFSALSGISIARVHDMSPYYLMRAEWDSSGPHCEGVPGVWNTVIPTRENGSGSRPTQTLAETTVDALMTEDNLVFLEMDPDDGPGCQLRVLSF